MENDHEAQPPKGSSKGSAWGAWELLQTLGPEEEMGYDAPFSIFTWERWLEMQSKLVTGCARFQRAVERGQPRLAALIALEMQEITMELIKEACAWVDTDVSAMEDEE